MSPISQSLPSEQLGDGEDRADAHLVGLATGDGETPEGAERLEPAPFGKLCVHHHAGRRAVGELAGIAGGDPFAFAHRLECGEPFRVVSGRLPSSLVSVTGSKLSALVVLSITFFVVGIGTVSSSKRLACCPVAVRRWLSSA